MEITGFVAALLMGVLLGLIGGGGSILTVPIFVYLFGIEPMLATVYSLFVVGVTSLAGSVSHFRKGNVNIRAAVVFGIPSVVGVLTVRKFLLPILPDPVFNSGGYILPKGTAILALFALLMLAASWSMLSGNKRFREKPDMPFRPGLILMEGLVVGSITGLVGAGGGFLIIPALVILAGLPMKEAVGTSLVIITMKSLIGFAGEIPVHWPIDYQFISVFSLYAIAGIIGGSNLTRIIDNRKLKPVFGWFVLVMGAFILVKELMQF